MTMTFIEKMTLTKESARKFFDKKGERLRSETTNDWSLIQASEFLLQNNGTIDWCGPTEDQFGYETIYEYAAGEFFGKGKKFREKAEYSNSHAHIMKNGFNRLAEHYLEQWGGILFRVPRFSNRKAIEVISLDPDYVINAKGQTIADVYCERDNKMMAGQLRTTYQRNAIVYGQDKAKQNLNMQLVDLISTTQLPPFNTNPLLTVHGIAAG